MEPTVAGAIARATGGPFPRGAVLATCKTCGTEFELTRSDRLYCQPSCAPRTPHKGGRSTVSGKPVRPLPTPFIDRPFRAWDGEGHDGRFTLLANSEGENIYDARGLSTQQCLEFLVSRPGKYADVWFSFGYDVNMMLRDLSWKDLRDLRDKGSVYWNGYMVTYAPRKFFQVSHRPTKRFHYSYDVWGFFQSSFVGALEAWGLNPSDVIVQGKNQREAFGTWKRTDLIAYNHAECIALVALMERLRSAIVAAGWSIGRWDGAGALASWFLRAHSADRHLTQTDALKDPLLRAYFGGRIDATGFGDAGIVHHYDITSAYPSAMRECPSLVGLDWKLRTGIVPDQPFALSHIRWNDTSEHKNGPFPFRWTDGSIAYPPTGEGWYWLPEIEAAQTRFGNRLQIEHIESFVPSGELFYPMREPIEEAFVHRLAYKRAGNPAHVPIKLALNSLYGKTAQTRGWRGTVPRFYTLEWASFLTACTRAKIQDALGNADVIMSMTDGIWTRDALPEWFIGDGLGRWEDAGTGRLQVVTPGVYQFDADVFTRGWERSTFPDGLEPVLDQFRKGVPWLAYKVRRFVGMGLALMGGHWKVKWRLFVDMKREIANPEIFGTTKRTGDHSVPRRGGLWRELNPLAAHGGLSEPYTSKLLVPTKEILEARAAEECEDD